MHSSPPTPFLHAFFSHQYSRPGHGMFPRLSVASPRPPPRLQALRRRPLRALLSLTLEFHLVLLPLASGKRKGHAIPPPQTSVWKVDRRGGVVVLVQRSTKDQDQERSRGDTTRDGTEPPTSSGAHESDGGARRASAGGMFRHRQPGTRAEVPVEDAGALRRSPFPPAKTLTS